MPGLDPGIHGAPREPAKTSGKGRCRTVEQRRQPTGVENLHPVQARQSYPAGKVGALSSCTLRPAQSRPDTPTMARACASCSASAAAG